MADREGVELRRSCSDSGFSGISRSMSRSRSHRSRGGKRGGAQEHCSQKEMDKTTLGRRIQAKSTALVAIYVKRVIVKLLGQGQN